MTDPLIEIDPFGELAALRSTDAYLSASHAATTIAKQPGIRVVLIALKPGGRSLVSRTAPRPGVTSVVGYEPLQGSRSDRLDAPTSTVAS
jgi:hypothetical protein